MPIYYIPAKEAKAEIEVRNSRFIAFTTFAFSVEEAKKYLEKIRKEFPDATHHVSAYLIGGGNSCIAHCHDDGEPSGTAGKPVLAVLSGSGFGDIVVVVVRYFGGTKLGSGGLVHAYSGATKAVLAITKKAIKVNVDLLKISFQYRFYEQISLIIGRYQGIIVDTEFSEDVAIMVKIPVILCDEFKREIIELASGMVKIEINEPSQTILLPVK
jgi:uncharacterized YigZ family protein